MDGHAATRRLRHLAQHADVRIAAIAGACSQRQFVSHISNGIFVGVKPFIRTAVRVRCALSAKPAARGACHGRAVGEQAQRGQVPVP